MIIKAKHHKIITPFFKYYTQWKINKHFHKVSINGVYEEKNLPLLIISNHLSWWDGFWMNYLNTKIFKRKFHFMMLEEQLIKYRILNYTGGFSIKKGNRSIIDTISYTAELLNNTDNLVLIFPQGEIQSIHTRTIIFESGIERILSKVQNKIQILFVTNLIEYLSNSKPSIFIYLTEYSSNNLQKQNIQSEYNSFFNECISKKRKQ